MPTKSPMSGLTDILTAPFKQAATAARGAAQNVKRRVVEAIATKTEKRKQEEEERELLDYWEKQFEHDRRAKQEWDDRFDEWEALYHGNRVFGNLRDDTNETVRTVINFARMVIEAQVDLNVPEPRFEPVSQDDDEAVKALLNQVKYAVRAASPSLEEINLEDERRVPKFGGTYKKVHWNNNIKRAGYVGDVEISNPHPKDIIPNSGATDMEDLEHYHHPVNRTAKYILRKWKHLKNEDLEQHAMLYEEFDEMLGDQEIPVTSPETPTLESGLTKYTIIETTYRDDDGDICKLWWSGDLLIKHLPKFYYRRDPETGEIMTMETLPAGTEIPLGNDENGVPKIMVVMEDTEIEYYIPTSWDIVYQLNINRDKCWYGISVMEDVKDIVESLKKVIHIEEEKILMGTTKILTDDKTLIKKLLSPTSEFIYTPNLNAVKEIRLGDDGQRGIAWITMMKEYLQLLTGTTNPAMGQETSNVTSGKQAELYIAQANQKIDVKTAYKSASYKRLYRVIADFYMAFSDQDRPYRLEGEGGKPEFGVFNRLHMLRDHSGNLVYPDYDIEIGAEAGFFKNKVEVFNMLMSLAVKGKFATSPENLVFLNVLNKLGVPYLNDVISGMEDEIAAIREMQQQTGMGLPPGARPGMPGAGGPPGAPMLGPGQAMPPVAPMPGQGSPVGGLPQELASLSPQDIALLLQIKEQLAQQQGVSGA